MKSQEDIIKEINILELIISKITRYFDKSLAIDDLIYDLEGYLDQLSFVDELWKKHFKNIWAEMEIVYSLALDQGLKTIPDENNGIVENTLYSLKEMSQDKIIDLEAMIINNKLKQHPINKNCDYTNLLYSKICAILLREWDPIGIKDIPEVQDEYNSYAASICEQLILGKSENDLFQYLCNIEKNLVKIPVNEQRNKIIAKRLNDCFLSTVEK